MSCQVFDLIRPDAQQRQDGQRGESHDDERCDGGSGNCYVAKHELSLTIARDGGEVPDVTISCDRRVSAVIAEDFGTGCLLLRRGLRCVLFMMIVRFLWVISLDPIDGTDMGQLGRH